jgi:hypothetical protein
MVLDFKTGDATGTPRREHGGKGRWKDLQLPLYRHLLEHLLEPLPGFDANQTVSTGYVRLSKTTGENHLSAADWTMDELEDADETARAVIRELWNLCEVTHDPSDRLPRLVGSMELLLGQRTLLPHDPEEGEG